MEDEMDRSSRIAQAYGYAVCLIAIITILISAAGMVNAAFDMSDPLRAGGSGRSGQLTSYAAYKREHLQRQGTQTRPRPAETDSATAQPSETELRQMFEDERTDQIGNVRFRSTRTLVTSLLMIIIASGLFLMHWRWLRREDQKP